MGKVSVIIPAYNKAGLTVKTVESVLNQTYRKIETIVVDDGSTDNTKQLLSRFGDKIKYVYKKNEGVCSARNLGIKLSPGDYIALLDCDDTYLPKKIELCVDYLQNNPEFGFVYTAAYFIDETNNILREYPRRPRTGWIAKKLLLKNFIPNSTPVIRRECFERAGLFDQSVFTPADWDMWIRLSENYKAGYINLPLTKYRISGSYILKNLEQTETEELLILTKALSRNRGLGKHFKNEVISNTYLRSAINYLLVSDFSSAKNKFLSSLNRNTFNSQALLLFGYFMIAKNDLRQKVIKKIFSKNIFENS